MMLGDERRDLSDEELMLRFQAGEGACLALLYERHFAQTLRACMGWVRNRAEAEDLVAETFLRILAKGDSLRPVSVRALLLRIARNLCFNRNGSSRVKRCVPLEESIQMPASEESSGVPFSAKELEKALQTLSKDQQVCLKLLLVGYSYKRISGETGLSEKAVKAHIQNGREKLKRLLRKDRP